MTNPWLAHVRKTMGEHPGKTFTYILKRANRTYKKGGKKGGKKKKKKKNKSRKTKRKRKNKKKST
tara:strand:- start:323 stop:517 length:195 start_codon:yes stop_codon:yes gene_type:complete